MVTNRPIREGKMVKQAGLKRAQHKDLRAAISKSRIRVKNADRRDEELAKASESGLTTDDLLEITRRRLKRESETCVFENKEEVMRNPLDRLYKPRRRTALKTRHKCQAAKKLRKALGCPKPTDNKKPTMSREDRRRRAKEKKLPPWRRTHDENHSCSGFLKSELIVAECSSTE